MAFFNEHSLLKVQANGSMPVQLFVDTGKHTKVTSVYGGSVRIEDTQINKEDRIQPQRGTASPPGKLGNILQNTSEPGGLQL